jgi:hypothetical protein
VGYSPKRKGRSPNCERALSRYLVTSVVTVFDAAFPLSLLTFAVLVIVVPTAATAFTLMRTSTGVKKVSEGVVQVTVLPAKLQLERPPEADTKLTPLGSGSVMTTEVAVVCNERLPTVSEYVNVLPCLAVRAASFRMPKFAGAPFTV